jgi:hypothetical protein
MELKIGDIVYHTASKGIRMTVHGFYQMGGDNSRSILLRKQEEWVCCKYCIKDKGFSNDVFNIAELELVESL